jgi:hypothetical protein
MLIGLFGGGWPALEHQSQRPQGSDDRAGVPAKYFISVNTRQATSREGVRFSPGEALKENKVTEQGLTMSRDTALTLIASIHE